MIDQIMLLKILSRLTDWLVLTCNNIINVQTSGMSQRDFDRFLLDKYGHMQPRITLIIMKL